MSLKQAPPGERSGRPGSTSTRATSESGEQAVNDGSPRWLSSVEQRAWRTHLAAHKLLEHRLDRELQAFGLSVNDYEILVNLSETPGHRMRMSDLADATIQSRSRLSHQISRMETAGLVVRETCADDRRGTFAVLTDHGWATIQKVAPHHVASVRRHFIDLLTDDQLQELETAYTPVVEHLKSLR
ncbi:DNA-binding MarR family transcriptional regulator [Streptosporangium becharense]|uniref:DNA-binding MarR family transcriptional regulator n=1 Tax=Streptosporangium becharense TaxID=1816182 RepID=A0A7W9MFD1_9ACTN|nr:MarR family winged helix-turn-helix transcriptional regulator [Streptosporangium becharense]MBB2912972.1 DNA-binding MarR family transcriptional regulator [Streptosporangium becharense]MBB5818203.1 DNA-binding MarR family transcriptional regulator [Streptosporangium becharense]